jgi:hypothetical protein
MVPMVIRVPFRAKPKQDRLACHPSGLNRTDDRRLSARDLQHRERMLRHLERLARAAQ